MGLTERQWTALPPHERLDLLAYDYKRQQTLSQLLDTAKNARTMDALSAFMSIVLAQIA
jgi:hypothetical protein